MRVKIKRKFSSNIIEVGRDKECYFVSAPEEDFIEMIVSNVVSSLPKKLSYSVRMETIKEIVKEIVKTGITEALESLKYESRRLER